MAPRSSGRQGRQESSTAGHWDTDSAPPWRPCLCRDQPLGGRERLCGWKATPQWEADSVRKRQRTARSLRYPWRPPEGTGPPTGSQQSAEGWGVGGGPGHFLGCHTPLLKVCSPCETVNTPKQEPTFNEQLFHAGHSEMLSTDYGLFTLKIVIVLMGYNIYTTNCTYLKCKIRCVLAGKHPGSHHLSPDSEAPIIPEGSSLLEPPPGPAPLGPRSLEFYTNGSDRLFPLVRTRRHVWCLSLGIMILRFIHTSVYINRSF